jgi:hypothetical protein
VVRAEDEIRIDAEDSLGAIEGLEVRRRFSCRNGAAAFVA